MKTVIKSDYVEWIPLSNSAIRIDVETEALGWGFNTDDNEFLILKVIKVQFEPKAKCNVVCYSSIICASPIKTSDELLEVGNISCNYVMLLY